MISQTIGPYRILTRLSGGGMGFIFEPGRKVEAQARLQKIMSAAKHELEHALPFAMEPVVYDFAINERGTFAEMLSGEGVLMPGGYYALIAPPLLKQDRSALSPLRRAELDRFGAACRTRPMRSRGCAGRNASPRRRVPTASAPACK